MKVYECIKGCTISFRDKDNMSTNFVLYPGDFFFIEENIGWRRNLSFDKRYVPTDMLTKIYHNKLVDFTGITNKYEWTWIDINIIQPLMNSTFSVYDQFCLELVKDVTLSWNRDNILDSLLNN